MKADLETQAFPFLDLSRSRELLLSLIRQELQGARFIHELERLGFNSGFFAIDLGEVILPLMGFAHQTDELWEWYCETLHSFAARADMSDSLRNDELVLEFYLALWSKHKCF